MIVRRALIAVLIALLPAVAAAKDFKSMPAFDIGGRWIFGYQTGAKEVVIQPGLAYGGTFTQIIDFSWARNMAFEANYLHSFSHGETESEDGGDVAVFDITMDSGSANIGYFFSGRKLLPYISTGLGVAVLKYEPEAAVDKVWEQDVTFNIGGGADWTLWEAAKSGALDRILLGARVRYEYIAVQQIFDVGMSALAITGRFELRF
ncbi:MAG: outer membrane beta-barrel protein [Deltaproteobacteria bacterium]|nr:outer membrane beta-barrel protein [Deltaproteobacteria bacterium]